MGEIGWAFISGKVAGGDKGAVQYNDGDTWITGSNNFKYLEESNTVVVSSSVFVSGTLFANDYHVNTINETITNLSSQGSSVFGNTADDTHQFTGSMSINGNFELMNATATFSSSVGSDLIYELSGTYYSASNANVPVDAIFDRAISPALVVSGTAVFNDPVSIQGGLYGASPIQVYAPMSFQDIENDTNSILEPGKFTGDLEVVTTNVNDGFKVSGPGGIIIESDNDVPLLRAIKLANTSVANHPNMSSRESVSFGSFLNQVETRIPIFTGSNQEDLNDYSLQQLVSSRVNSKTDFRRNSYLITFEVPHTEFDSSYESLEAINDPSLTGSATGTPFTTSDFDELSNTIKVMDVGSFANVGDSNAYGVRRGMKLAGNMIPSPIDRTALGKDGVPYPDFQTKDLTIGHPSARWGDLYISNERKVSWGNNINNVDWFTNSQEHNSASLGYEALFDALVVDGSRLKLNDDLQINSNGYINFNQINGTDGYGFRDNNGTMQFKNQTGNWVGFSSVVGASGPSGSVQISDGSGGFISNTKLSFIGDTLTVDGTIVANEIIVNTIDQTVVNISMTGSTSFGDTSDDTHDFVGSMNISGSLSLNRKVITNNYTLLSTDHFVGVDSSTNLTIQLPLASELSDGQFFTIKDENGATSKQIILQCSGSDEIDGEASISLTSPYTAINFYSNGQNKFFIF